MTKEIYLAAKRTAALLYKNSAIRELAYLKPNQKAKINTCKRQIAQAERIVDSIDSGKFWNELSLWYYETIYAPLADSETSQVSPV